MLQSRHTTLTNPDHWHPHHIPTVATILDFDPHLRSNSEQQPPINNCFVTTPEGHYGHRRSESPSLQYSNSLTATLEIDRNGKTKMLTTSLYHNLSSPAKPTTHDYRLNQPPSTTHPPILSQPQTRPKVVKAEASRDHNSGDPHHTHNHRETRSPHPQPQRTRSPHSTPSTRNHP
jgi:hypothetical protein